MTKKKQKTILNSDFEKCKTCVYFPDISVSKYDYYVDDCGVKHRNIQYICQYDLHEIKGNNIKCTRHCNESK